MTSPLTVRAEPKASARGAVAWSVAALPVSLALAPHGRDADLHAIDGAEGWPQRVAEAAERGARGVLVVAPVAESADESVLAVARGVPVVLDHGWASSPGILRARAALSETSAPVLVDVAAAVERSADLAEGLLRQLVVARALFGPIPKPTLVEQGPNAILAVGRTASSPLTFSVSVAPAGAAAATVKVVTSGGGLRLHLPSSASARPALVTTVDASGATLQPTVWESPHRASWRRLARAVRAREVTDDLADFSEVVALLGEPSYNR